MFRQYSSVFGRWTSPDPYGGSVNLFDTQTLNRYAYVMGSPLTMNDRSGLNPAVDAYLYYFGSTVPDSLFVSNLLGALAPIGFAVDIFDLGKDFGLWDTGPQFHGNVAASQSGKIVPNAPQQDGFANCGCLAQGVFHGAGQPYWGAADSMVTDATIGYTGAIGAFVLAPAAVDIGLTSLAEGYGASLATANGTDGVMIGAYYQGSAFSYEAVAAEQGMNFFYLPGYSFWEGLGGYGQIANDAFINAAIESGQTIYTSSAPWMTGGVGYWSETGILSNAGVPTVAFFP